MSATDESDVDALVKSDAFYRKYRNEIGKRVLYEAQSFDPINVEYECSPRLLEQILQHIGQVWTRLGSEDAHWSVVSTPAYRNSRIQDTIQQFNQSGKTEVRNLRRLLARVRVDPSRVQTALEYGCGVGRVTRWLATEFPYVLGVDVSETHLQIARDYFATEHVNNVDTRRISSFEDVERLPEFDFLYSKIVLQHNPPPVIHRTLDALFGKLRSSGVGVIQIPTYCKGYSFVADAYVKTMDDIEKMEMHVLPQAAVFDLFERHSCRPVEVFRDHLITSVDFVSSTFVFTKS